MSLRTLGFFVVTASVAVASAQTNPAAPKVVKPTKPAYVAPVEVESDRTPRLSIKGDFFIRGARILTITKGVIDKGDILVKNGKIAQIGAKLTPPAGIRIIEAKGLVAAPGLVDAHSHRVSDATNEGSDSITAETRIYDVLDPDDLASWQALASGITSALILHGSANSVGGQSIVVKYKYKHSVEETIIPDAPRMIKFALGENVTRSSSPTSTRFPRTRMGVQAVYRRGFTEAKAYMAAWDKYEKDKVANPKMVPPRRDLRLETLADILRRKIWVQCHSYRGDEMLMMVRLSQEFGFKIGAMQHSLEAYKIAPDLAAAKVPASMFQDYWSYKLEAYDAIPYNAYVCWKAGVNVSLNTDSGNNPLSLNTEAARAVRGGVPVAEALKMLTINPALQLGIDHRTGSLEVGKDADIVLWTGHPLSGYSKPQMTFVDGELLFQRKDLFNIDRFSVAKPDLNAAKFSEPVAPKEAKAFAIVGGTVYPVSGKPIAGGTVVFVNGKITAVGKGVAIPAGATRINAAGLNVFPGLIDGGTQLGLAEVSSLRNSVDSSEFGEYQPDLEALTAVQVQSEHIPPARMNGILSVLTRPSGGIIGGQAAVMNTFGFTREDMGLKPKALLAVNFPSVTTFGNTEVATDDCHCDELGDKHQHDIDLEFRAGIPQAPATPELPASVKALADYLEKARKYDRKAGVDLSLEAMQPYVKGQLPLLLRVRNAASIRAAVAFAKSARVKIVLGGAEDAWREADLLAKEKIPVILNPPNRGITNGDRGVAEWDPYDTPAVAAGILARAGVKFAFETNDNAMTMNLPFRIGMAVGYGLPWDRALRAATLDAAEILGVSKQVGSLEPGKMANVFVCAGDPFEAVSSMRYVFVAGRPVPLTSKFTRLRDQYLARVK